MQLTFLILVLSYYTKTATPNPPPQTDPTWRRSRYIIDNRRNALFSKKLLPSPIDPVNFRFSQERLFPVGHFHKDLTAEASISEPKFYRKYGENSLPRKIIKSYKITGNLATHPSEYKYNGIFENQRNTTGVLDPHNSFQNEDEVLNDVAASRVVTTTEKVLTWVPKINEGVLVSMSSSTPTTPKDVQNTDVSSRSSPAFEFGLPTTTTYPWKITNSKTEEGNQIDSTNEKHVYETRIETVSYHQEVIFNPPKKQTWYREEDKQEPENYEEPEKNYEQSEENYEEPEKNYEIDEAMNVMSEGRVQAESEENQNKFGYVVEGTNYKKYRVEERTPDGFIVGEYGVVSHDDGSLRGVRYTADGNTNPKLIYETLIKFLSL